MNKAKTLDFSGPTIFCALDTHKKSWRINNRDKVASKVKKQLLQKIAVVAKVGSFYFVGCHVYPLRGCPPAEPFSVWRDSIKLKIIINISSYTNFKVL